MPPEEEGLSWAPETGFHAGGPAGGKAGGKGPGCSACLPGTALAQKVLKLPPLPRAQRLGAVCFRLLCSQGSLAESSLANPLLIPQPRIPSAAAFSAKGRLAYMVPFL